MPKALIAAVDDYRFSNRVPSRAEAIRRLIELGLGMNAQISAPPSLVGHGAQPEDDPMRKVEERRLAAAQGRKSAERAMKRVGAKPLPNRLKRLPD